MRRSASRHQGARRKTFSQNDFEMSESIVAELFKRRRRDGNDNLSIRYSVDGHSSFGHFGHGSPRT